MSKKFDVKKHALVPKSAKLSEKEKEELLQKFKITTTELPRILKTDPMLSGTNPKTGDVFKILRASPTAGRTVFYRVVGNG